MIDINVARLITKLYENLFRRTEENHTHSEDDPYKIPPTWYEDPKEPITTFTVWECENCPAKGVRENTLMDFSKFGFCCPSCDGPEIDMMSGLSVAEVNKERAQWGWNPLKTQLRGRSSHGR